MHIRARQASTRLVLLAAAATLLGCSADETANRAGSGAAAKSSHSAAPRAAAGSIGCKGSYGAAVLGLRPRLTIGYTLHERQWPELERLLKDFGARAGLQISDTSSTRPEMRVFELSLCKPKSVVILTRQQLSTQYDDPDEPVRGRTYLYQQPEFYGWRDIGEALVKDFERQGWKIDVEWSQPRIDLDALIPVPARSDTNEGT